ncbi:MAG: D-alanine--D-alanine ligase [candidate division WOR-3 bacterium]
MRRLRKCRVGVLMGGWSSERSVSLRSGQAVLRALHRLGYDAVGIDIGRDFARQIEAARIGVAFVMLHGRPGEDGTIQGYLELVGIPYTGSGIAASSIAMDKFLSKQLMRAAGVPVPECVLVPRRNYSQFLLTEAAKRLGLPLILKPRFEGSSVGIRLLRSARSLATAVESSLQRFGDVLLERYVPGMIATVGILDKQVLPVLELVPRKRAFYDYHAKYTPGATRFVIPARLESRILDRVGRLSLDCHRAIGCHGFSRIDLVVENREDPYFLEVNTIPGMTDVSDLPAQAASAGISYDELVERILKSAFSR